MTAPTLHVYDHQGKSAMLTKHLFEAGYVLSQAADADVLLIDIDDPDAPGRGRLICECDGMIALYPHGALPTYHGCYEPDDRVDVQLVHAPGQQALIEQMGLDRRVETIGWSYSPRVEFRPPDEIRSVLFAPAHPYGSGALHEHEKRENRRVYDLLTGHGFNVSVHMYGTPAQNGLPLMPRTQSTLRIDWDEIDRADLVVAKDTYACLALARGKPCVMFAQDMSYDEHGRPQIGPVAAAERYPVDIDDGPLDDVLAAACANAGASWVNEWVGGPFDTAAALTALQHEPAVAA